MVPGAINGDPPAAPDGYGIHGDTAITGQESQRFSSYGEVPSGGVSSTTSTPTSGTDSQYWSKQQLQRRASSSRKLTARTMPFTSSSSLNSLSSQISSVRLDSTAQQADDDRDHYYNTSSLDFPSYTPPTNNTNTSDDTSRIHQSLLIQVFNWLKQERGKLSAKGTAGEITGTQPSDTDIVPAAPAGGGSRVEESSLALDQLEYILSQHSTGGVPSSSSSIGRRKVSSSSSTPHHKRYPHAMRALRRGSTSDSDYADADRPVPSAADVVLDNSKTLLYSGGEADCDLPPSSSSSANAGVATPTKPSTIEREHWLHFKSEILRLTHTLGFKGWRRVPLDAGRNVEVVRLSGALTNAVYVVSPPKNMPPTSSADSSGHVPPRKRPQKLLLRIYGPQVEHLIDRERELRILRRLAKKNIGPRVLGTFKNGRFEEYFYARTLTCRDLRIPETSKQIAKRMRELHDGIELLPEERAGGPTIWQNWDKWVGRCEQVITWLDNEITSEENRDKAQKEPWRKRGYVCGVPWSKFRRTVDRYRKWLDDLCGGPAGMKEKLVFAHNDTQYGNLLRLEPSGESPLLLPSNEHKQLVVIDFEYSSANTKAFEFANHFTEWCYNYHDAEKPWACHPTWYPTTEEQERFIRAYLKHRSGTSNTTGSTSSHGVEGATPAFQPTYTSSPRIPPFALDSNVPSSTSPASGGGSGGASADHESRDREQDRALETETSQLLRETRLWRIANSAQWVAWGIVQAKVPGLEAALSANANANANANSNDVDVDGISDSTESASHPSTPTQEDHDGNQITNDQQPHCAQSTAQVIQEVEAQEVAEEFDYLAYAQDRAFFFWADILALGLIKEDEFPEEMVGHIKKRVIEW